MALGDYIKPYFRDKESVGEKTPINAEFLNTLVNKTEELDLWAVLQPPQYVPNAALAAGTVSGQCVLPNSNDEYIPSENGIGIVDITKRVVTSGVCNPGIPLVTRKNVYAQSDGSINHVSSTFRVGYALSETLMLVAIEKPAYGEDNDYTDNLPHLVVTPGTSGKLQIKFELPDSADGVLFKYRTDRAWQEGDNENDGTTIADLTTDIGYMDQNEWYEATGLSDGTQYWVKGFPYLGSVYNNAIGVNEVLPVKAGGLINRYTGDSISGATLLDTAGTKHGTNSNVTTSAGKVGNALVYNGSNAKTGMPNSWTDFLASNCTIEFWVYSNGDSGTILSFVYGSYSSIKQSGSNIIFNMNNADRVSGAVTTSAWTHVAFTRSTSNGMEMFVNGVSVDTDTYTGADGSLTYENAIGYFRSALPSWWSGRIDQLMFYNRVLTKDEITARYNGGLGC